MKITILGVLAGLLLLAIPFYVLFRYRLKVMGAVFVALVRMSLLLAVAGGVMYLTAMADSVAVTLGLSVLMAVAASLWTCWRSRLRARRCLIPVMSGMCSAALVVGLYVLVLVTGSDSPFSVSMVLPIFGIILGTVASCNARALYAYYVGLENHRQIYDYLIGNGASHKKAVNTFVRRALEANVIPQVRRMANVMVGVSPAMMWGMVLGGMDVPAAVIFDLLLTIAVLSASVLSLVIAITVARRYDFDEYQALRPGTGA